MAVREIVTVPNEILRQVAKPVETFDPELRTLVRDMIETMRVANGVGLAGPQIAELRRVIVIEVPQEEDDDTPPSRWIGKPFAIVNPQMVAASETMEAGIEGCLSIPGYVGEVMRHTEIVVIGRNEWGKPIRIEANGFLARVLQHEIDHLDGILYTDKLTAPDRFWEAAEADEQDEPLAEPSEAS